MSGPDQDHGHGKSGEGPHIHHGKSSRDFLNAAEILDAFEVGPEETVLDLGCGEGHFAIEAAERVDFDTAVYALDQWEPSIEALREELEERGVRKVKPILADATEEIPIPEDTVRLGLMVNVLHGFVHNGEFDDLMEQLVPVLHTRCRIVVVEFRKLDDMPGPPLGVRLAPGEVVDLFGPYGFGKGRGLEISDNHYGLELVR